MKIPTFSTILLSICAVLVLQSTATFAAQPAHESKGKKVQIADTLAPQPFADDTPIKPHKGAGRATPQRRDSVRVAPERKPSNR